MRPIRQRSETDCLCACIASLLEIPLALVPDYSSRPTGDDQTKATQRWLRKLGYTLVEVEAQYKKRRLCLPMALNAVPVYAIASLIVNEHEGWGHAVVVRVHKRIQWVHDPAGGTRKDYGRYIRFGFLVPLDPKVKE